MAPTSIAKTASKEIRPFILLQSFFLLRLLCIYKSTILSFLEYYCHFWAGVSNCYLEIFDKLQKAICKTIVPSLVASLELLAYRRNGASLILFCRYYFYRCSSGLGQLVPLPYCQGSLTRYCDRLHDFFVTITIY